MKPVKNTKSVFPKPNQATPPESLNAEAQSFWRKYYGTCVHSEADTLVFYLLCNAYSNVQKFRAEIDRATAPIQGRVYLARDKADATYLTLLKEFGLTPRSRGRVTRAEPAPVEWDEF